MIGIVTSKPRGCAAGLLGIPRVLPRFPWWNDPSTHTQPIRRTDLPWRLTGIEKIRRLVEIEFQLRSVLEFGHPFFAPR